MAFFLNTIYLCQKSKLQKRMQVEVSFPLALIPQPSNLPPWQGIQVSTAEGEAEKQGFFMKVCMLSIGSSSSFSTSCSQNATIQMYILLHRNQLSGFAGEQNLFWQQPWVFSLGFVKFLNVKHSYILFGEYKPEAWLLIF